MIRTPKGAIMRGASLAQYVVAERGSLSGDAEKIKMVSYGNWIQRVEEI